MIAAIAAILLRLFFIQVVDSSYKVTASNNVLHYVTQYPARGIIFDRNNEVLVSNQAAYDLMIIKNQVKAFDTLEFARLLSITKEQVQENFKSMMRSRYFSAYKQYPFIKQISAKDYARFQEKMFLFPGFFVQARTLRTYPFNIAGGLFGYVGGGGVVCRYAAIGCLIGLDRFVAAIGAIGGSGVVQPAVADVILGHGVERFGCDDLALAGCQGAY